MDLAGQYDLLKGFNTGFPAVFAFPKPVVTAVRGVAIAGGFFYVMISDFRVAGPRAKFGLAEVRVGADLPLGLLEITRATLDVNMMRRMLLTGMPINAAEALNCGIVDVLEDNEDDVLERALRAAREMAANPPKTFASLKNQIRGETLARIDAVVAAGANTPESGWFTDETKAAMKRMLDGTRG